MVESYDTKLSQSYNIRTEVDLETGDVEFSLVFDNGEVAERLDLDLIGLVEAYGDFENHIDAVFAAQSILLKVTKWMTTLELESSNSCEPDWDDMAKDQRLEREAS